MCECHRTHNQRQKRTGAGAIIARRTDDHDDGQDRDERHINSCRYNSDSVRMFDSIRMIELESYQNRSLAGLRMATRGKIWVEFKRVRYNESSVQRNKE